MSIAKEFLAANKNGASDFPVDECPKKLYPDEIPFGFYVMISTCCVR